MSVRLGDLEDLVRLALENGLVGQRQALLQGLPLGFVYSLPTVSRPIDQLRFDLMELSRTPRLIGLDEAPLNVWLTNAATLLETEGKLDAAGAFARRAGKTLKSAPEVRRIQALPSAAIPTSTSTSSSQPRPTASPDAEYDIFLAYPGPKERLADALYESLSARGYRVFFDSRSLKPGSVWVEDIPNALKASDTVCALFAPHEEGYRKPWYHPEEIIQSIEARRDTSATRLIIPVLLPGFERKSVQFGLAGIVPLVVDAGAGPDAIAAAIAAAVGPAPTRS